MIFIELFKELPNWFPRQRYHFTSELQDFSIGLVCTGGKFCEVPGHPTELGPSVYHLMQFSPNLCQWEDRAGR